MCPLESNYLMTTCHSQSVVNTARANPCAHGVDFLNVRMSCIQATLWNKHPTYHNNVFFKHWVIL